MGAVRDAKNAARAVRKAGRTTKQVFTREATIIRGGTEKKPLRPKRRR